MTAIRCATSACSCGGSPDRTSEALSGVMWASTSAITCGCSSAMNERSWPGSAWCRNWNGICTAAALSRSDDLVGPVGAERLLEQVLGEGQAALGDVRAGGRPCRVNSAMTASISVAAIDVEPGDLGGDRLDLVRRRGGCSTSAAWSRPSWISRIAALRTPSPARVMRHQRALHQPAAQQRGDLVGLTLDQGGDLTAQRRRSRPARHVSSAASAGAGSRRRPWRAVGGVLAQLLDEVRRGARRGPCCARAARQPGEQQHGEHGHARCRRCGSSSAAAPSSPSAALAAASSAAAALSAVRSNGS